MHVCAIKRAAVIKDAQHNTSQLINITPQICISTGSHSLLKNPPACISASVYPSILPTHISFNVIPEDTASFPGEVVNVTDYLYAAASVPVLSGYSTEIFKKINPSRMTLTRMNSAFLAPSKPSMDHPAVCEQVLAPSLQTHSGRQLVGKLPFFFKAPQAEQIRGPAQLRG